MRGRSGRGCTGGVDWGREHRGNRGSTVVARKEGIIQGRNGRVRRLKETGDSWVKKGSKWAPEH